jgi:small nuclear ribonucleoprotein D2
MVLENVKEMWTDAPKAGGSGAGAGAGAKGQKKRVRVARDRFVPKMFLRGDSVILVLRNPK